MQPRHEFFHAPLRLVAAGSEHFEVILVGEMRTQQRDRRQRERPFCQRSKYFFLSASGMMAIAWDDARRQPDAAPAGTDGLSVKARSRA